ncbi:uncharacterized protein LOC126184141 [Schistocerca cancellata]|uniref:uncharacterized protein LOC126184141 n=1 Tax=Schistocerca cancellata TaxID=274614 RepID=UPI0021180D7B|nr:uncharacterized protein LOC126184141 [Schistocerca cancellata]
MLCGIAVMVAGMAAAACGHGMLWEPPNRGSLWRFGYETPVNYDDNAQFCGGFQAQWQKNGGRCGECGDDYSLERPRPQENGGEFGLAVIAATYERASVINATALITANHMGYFVFRLCPLEEEGQLETEECFSKWPLSLTDGSTEYVLPSNDTGYYSVELQLPEDLECKQCVLQWTYVAGNNWGVCDDGTQGLGCGPQETFRTCTDIAIA